MSEKPLLLYSAKSVVVVQNPRSNWLRVAAITMGFFVVFVGAANIATRLADTLGPNASLDIFAPAIAVTDPSALNSFKTATVSTGSTALTTGSSATTTPITPARLIISSIGVNANVEQVGKKADGSMGTPQTFGDVAWYALGAKPGSPGNAVIDGHVDNALTTAGVFMHLSQVHLGDLIEVADASGATRTFVVNNIQEVPADSAPDASIFTTTGPASLVLITCDGTWVPDAKSFDQRLEVFATLQ
ncbi:MAG TPA: class F sortase [Candidatus Paceibacterota bacterium]|nr:class F sortase [Candidatus Paceibacterota bacterium]